MAAGMAFDTVFSAYEYSGSIRDLLIRFKYHGYRRLAEPLGNSLAPLLKGKALSGGEIVIPIPSDPRRQWLRGFNPARLIANKAASDLGIPLCPQTLRRRWGGRRQVGLSKEARLRNVKGQFYIPTGHSVSGYSVILVDDIFTTGATSSEASHVLKEGGAASVVVVTVARD